MLATALAKKLVAFFIAACSGGKVRQPSKAPRFPTLSGYFDHGIAYHQFRLDGQRYAGSLLILFQRVDHHLTSFLPQYIGRHVYGCEGGSDHGRQGDIVESNDGNLVGDGDTMQFQSVYNSTGDKIVDGQHGGIFLFPVQKFTHHLFSDLKFKQAVLKFLLIAGYDDILVGKIQVLCLKGHPASHKCLGAGLFSQWSRNDGDVAVPHRQEIVHRDPSRFKHIGLRKDIGIEVLKVGFEHTDLSPAEYVVLNRLWAVVDGCHHHAHNAFLEQLLNEVAFENGIALRAECQGSVASGGGALGNALDDLDEKRVLECGDNDAYGGIGVGFQHFAEEIRRISDFFHRLYDPLARFAAYGIIAAAEDS